MVGLQHILLLFLGLTSFVGGTQSPVVTLGGNAKLRGTVTFTLTDSSKPVFTFRGVPFAQAPKRFLPAETLKLWNGERDATQEGYICYQNLSPSLLDGRDIKSVMSEDCLFLNVYTCDLDVNAKKDVMVWIHGGGFTGGAGTGYAGTTLASFHDVVVIAFNYRLAGLGFLTTGDSNAPGNIAFHDQLEALRWVQKYVHHFGGDPKKITLFGESAGAMSVNFHMVSPLSRDLFQRGISQSGVSSMGIYTTQDPLKHTSGIQLTKRIAQETGCPTSDNRKMVTCLRSKPADTFIKNTYIFIPVVDGIFLKDYPYNLYTLGNFNRKDYLLGFNTNEGHSLFPAVNSILNLDRNAITVDNVRSVMFSMLAFKGMLDMNLINIMMERYTSSIADKAQLFKVVVDYVGDFIITGPVIDTARKHAAEAKTYMYQYNYTLGTKTQKSQRPAWLVADHTEEIPLVFGFPFSNLTVVGRVLTDGQPFTNQDETMSNMMMSYFVNFAKTGDPNGKGLTHWPRHTCDNKTRLVLKPTPTLAYGFGHKMNLWTDEVPAYDKLRNYKGMPFKCPGPPVINIGQKATLKGFVSYIDNSFRKVYTFRGIPYAEKPARFLPALPLKLWDGERDATQLGAACVQNTTKYAQSIPSQLHLNTSAIRVSEDCLFLNIWTTSTDVNAKHNVMVWIHGGGFTTGSANEYSGVALASIHDVVVVAINYRLGGLGFVTTGDRNAPGNLALRDQQEALRWVQKYIKFFGGDPGNVTIFGQGAGSWSVSYHLVSPASGSLFRRAISQSGTTTSKLWFSTSDVSTAVSLTRKIAKEQGCPISDNTAMVACLQTRPAHVFTSGHYSIFVDGQVIPQHPFDLYTQGIVKGKEYLLGFNSDEGFTLFNTLVPKFESLGLNMNKLSRADARVIISSQLGASVGINETVTELMMKEYIGNRTDPGQIYAALVEFVGDMLIIAPVVDTARKHTVTGTTYLYLLEQSPGYARQTKPSWMRADHGTDIDYVLGLPFFIKQTLSESFTIQRNYTEADKALSQRIMAYWTNFAKTGNPNGPGVPFWPEYFCQYRLYAVLKSKPAIMVSYMPTRMALWSEMLPELDKNNTYKGHPWRCPEKIGFGFDAASYTTSETLLLVFALLVVNMHL